MLRLILKTLADQVNKRTYQQYARDEQFLSTQLDDDLDFHLLGGYFDETTDTFKVFVESIEEYWENEILYIHFTVVDLGDSSLKKIMQDKLYHGFMTTDRFDNAISLNAYLEIQRIINGFIQINRPFVR